MVNESVGPTKEQFRRMFRLALYDAAAHAESVLGHAVPRTFVIALHAPGFAGTPVPIETALDAIYLGSGKFYRIIDVAVERTTAAEVTAFVRVSGHRPTEWSATWNPDGPGPFKQVFASKIQAE